MTGKVTVQDEGSKFKLAIVVSAWCRRGVPELQASPHSDSEVTTRRGELKRGDTAFEGEVMNDNSAEEVGQDGATILVNGQEEVAARRESNTVNVGAVRKGKGIGGVAAGRGASVKYRDLIAHWGDQAGAIGRKEQITFAIDRTQ
ncbi:translation regulator [Aspergillus luchuensis]|uniref:Translation regulator n=1 Tax=Aspergillus kawachii TaxID=1069201 RepID=A0A146FPE2_ASPKA|nr:translation regulator [Aspergillus luchuensis]